MQLAMTVVLVVLGVTTVIGLAGYAIDASADQRERKED